MSHRDQTRSTLPDPRLSRLPFLGFNLTNYPPRSGVGARTTLAA